MKSQSKKPPAKEEKGGNLDRDNRLSAIPEDLPFPGLPYSYEGRFMALFQEEKERSLGNASEEKELAGEIAYWNSSLFSPLAKFKVVPLLAVLATGLLFFAFLVRALIEGHW